MPCRGRQGALAAMAALVLVGASPSRRATYRMHGAVHVAGAALVRDMELHADAVVEPGAGTGEVLLHLAAVGHRCKLVARRDAAGSLTFPPGQVCVLEIRSSEAQGRVEVHLASGSGRQREEDLSLSFRSKLSGAVRVGSGWPAAVLGLTAPGTGDSKIPIGGEAQATAEGRRDHSRAAEQ